MKLSYSIIGTGAVGGYIGIKLANAGHEVHFLANSDYEHIQQNGLKLQSVRGNIELKKVSVYSSTQHMPVCDVAFIALKTTQNHLLPDMLHPFKNKKTIFIILQNGIGMEEEIAQLFPENKVAGAPIYICAEKSGRGFINHQDIGTLTIGRYSLGIDEVLHHVAADLSQSDVPSNVTDNLALIRWKKLVWNVPFNGLSVVLNTTTDTIVNTPSYQSIALAIMHEIIAAANANNVEIDTSLAQKMIELTKGMKPYAPSMKVDYDNKRELEVKYLYSNALNVGTKHKIEMPETKKLEAQLIEINRINKKCECKK